MPKSFDLSKINSEMNMMAQSLILNNVSEDSPLKLKILKIMLDNKTVDLTRKKINELLFPGIKTDRLEVVQALGELQADYYLGFSTNGIYHFTDLFVDLLYHCFHNKSAITSDNKLVTGGVYVNGRTVPLTDVAKFMIAAEWFLEQDRGTMLIQFGNEVLDRKEAQELLEILNKL